MDIIHEVGSATASQVREAMPDPPSNPAVRSTLRILVEKGHLQFEQDGPRYLYKATVPAQRVRRSALRHVLRTFYGGSIEGAMAALLELDEGTLTPEESERLKSMIDEAAQEGR